MKPICAIVCTPDNRAEALCSRLVRSPLISSVIVLQPNPAIDYGSQIRVLEGGFPPGGRELNLALEHSDPATLLLLITQPRLEIEEPELQALVNRAAGNPDAAMLYSDFFAGSRQHIRPLIPYQNGSIRDDFFSARCSSIAVKKLRGPCAIMGRSAPAPARDSMNCA